MPTYKITYFDLRGLAEVSRQLLTYKGEKFEDIRLTPEQWAELKPKTPYGQLPLLEVDGAMIGQSMAIARFLARRLNLAGKGDIEQAQLESIADFQRDFQNEVRDFFQVVAGRKEGDKEKLHKELFIPAAQKHFAKLESLLDESGSGFYGKSGISWIDFHMSNGVETALKIAPDDIKKHPKLMKHYESIRALPQMKKYFAERKETQF